MIILDLVDFFGAGFVIYIIAILEIIGIMFIYGKFLKKYFMVFIKNNVFIMFICILYFVIKNHKLI